MDIYCKQLQDRIREIVRLSIPSDATVAVVSKGDNTLLELNGRRSWHFPQTQRGEYLGYHPADSSEAVAQLEALRAKGADYLLFPETSVWWLNHYAEFNRHLESKGRLVAREPGVGVIYALRRIRLARPRRRPSVVALLATHNEERFIGHCLEHLVAQGVEVYLLDNGSTDRTAEIARQWLGRGLRGLEGVPYDGRFVLRRLLERKEELAATLDADWFMHVDADEIHVAPQPGLTLAEALGAVEEAGFNAVNFLEFTFIPTLEAPDHDHPRYRETMRWYYPFLPQCPWAIRAWRRQSARVQLTASAGHRVQFPGIRLCPEFFFMKHYQFLSVPHAIRKYSNRHHDPIALESGVHGGTLGWREQFGHKPFALVSQTELREYDGDHRLDRSHPRKRHVLEDVTRSTPPRPATTRGSLLIKLEDINNSPHGPLFIGPRKRLASGTCVKLITSEYLIACNLVGQRLYLIRYDMTGSEYRVEDCIHTQVHNQDVSADLVDFDGKDLLVTSNCEHGSVSLYRLVGNKLAFEKGIPIEDSEAAFCHGVKFVPPDGALICATVVRPGRCVYFISAAQHEVIYKFSDGQWRPKDVCFLNDHRMIVAYDRGRPTREASGTYQAKLSYISFDLRNRRHEVIDEAVLEETSVDCCQYAGDRIYVNNQMGDSIVVYKLVNNRLTFARKITGFNFPHGLDVYQPLNLLAVSNYGDNTIVLQRLNHEGGQ